MRTVKDVIVDALEYASEVFSQEDLGESAVEGLGGDGDSNCDWWIYLRDKDDNALSKKNGDDFVVDWNQGGEFFFN